MQGGFFYLLDFIRPFLAMAEKEQVPLYSFGLTKTFSCWKRF